jgi:hypothetical protein
MSDTTVTTQAPPTPPMPNDAAARSPTGEILEPAQIAAQEAAKSGTTPPALNPDGTPAQTSTSKPPEKPADGKDPAKPAATTGAPEKYDDFKAPDGYTLDPKAIEAAVPIFKELGLTQDQAQRLVQFHSEQMIAAAKGPEETYTQMRTDWQAKVKADPDLAKAVNGDKTGLDAVKLDIGRALNALGDTQLANDFKEAMNLTGAGDHPAFVKTMWKLASFVTEGKHVSGQNPSPHGQNDPSKAKPATGAHALYPNLS